MPEIGKSNGIEPDVNSGIMNRLREKVRQKVAENNQQQREKLELMENETNAPVKMIGFDKHK